MSFWCKSMAVAFVFSTLCWAALIGGIATYIGGAGQLEHALNNKIKVVQ